MELSKLHQNSVETDSLAGGDSLFVTHLGNNKDIQRSNLLAAGEMTTSSVFRNALQDADL
jgi:hypothetical protein